MENTRAVVRAGQLPGKVQEVVLEPEVVHNVATVIQILAIKVEGFEIRVDGESANLETLVKDGTTIFFVKKIQGN